MDRILQALRDTIAEPALTAARALEKELIAAGYQSCVFGRVNQSSSIEANTESDRGIAERMANAFDASLTAARLSLGITKSDKRLAPRLAAQRFLCPDPTTCAWEPQDSRISYGPPGIRFWEEAPAERQRYRKYQPSDGLATVLVFDHGVGLAREEMPGTILALNSDAKLTTFEAIGRFGHGGSSSLFFCESALVMTSPRFPRPSNQVFWTLVFPEQEVQESKQELVRKWFHGADGLPLVLDPDAAPELTGLFPGTSIWHFGYHRSGWIKKIAGPEQTNPFGRLGRLFFSYPLPFEIHGSLARGDLSNQPRTVTTPFYRLLGAQEDKGRVEHFVPEKTERLLIEGESFGQFSLLAFVLPDPKAVRSYVDNKHPIVFTLNGQNHGEMTETILINANLPQLSSSMIVEVRLDGLEQEALSNIVSNSREVPKHSVFTRVMTERIRLMLQEDESLQNLERVRQEKRATESNQELNKRLTRFLADIASNAMGRPAPKGGGSAPGTSGAGTRPRPEVPACDPPQILEFIGKGPLLVPEGSTYLAKFRSDARPPKYIFHGDNPRLFVAYQSKSEIGGRITVVGKSDINSRGYGSISLHCKEDSKGPIREATEAGELELSLQSTDGRVLICKLPISAAPKPEPKQRSRERDVQVKIQFCAPCGDLDRERHAALIGEGIEDFGPYLNRFKDALDIGELDCSYWGEKYDKDGLSILEVEINVANPQLRQMLIDCKTAEEIASAKERYCRDVVLDCFQHCFRLNEIPGYVVELISGEDNQAKRAAEMLLNHDKAVRICAQERELARRR